MAHNERETMQATLSLDEGLARSMVQAVRTQNDERIIECENLILDRLNVSGDETEQGLTRNAVEQIEKFVSENTGHQWTYASA